MRDVDLEAAYNNWKKSQRSEEEAFKDFTDMLFAKLQRYTMTELVAITGIKRPTLYYYMYGKDGKSGRAA